MSTVTALRLGKDPETFPEARSTIVAVILSDGSVLELGESPGERPVSRRLPRYAMGTISGAGWTLWWDRRVFASG